jgi:hypothetical protein
MSLHDSRQTTDASTPPFPQSDYINNVTVHRNRYHQGVGDMWPLTWANDGNLYAGAGDNRESPMNLWRVSREPDLNLGSNQGDWTLDIVDNLPLDPAVYCTDPRVDKRWGLKPAGLLDLGGTLYFAVQSHNYGDNPAFNRQRNIEGWIITSDDYGRTWNREATKQTEFFSGRVTSCHFLQYGKGDDNVIDGYVYAYFPGASDDGNSYWCNGDYVLLGRVPQDRILDRTSWEFWVGLTSDGEPRWSPDDALAKPVMEYRTMTGENHVSYNAGLGRYIMGNYSFLDEHGNPRPYHQETWPSTSDRSQLVLLESPTMWGPWSQFHRDDNWGTYGDYQPAFPVKWMYHDGRTMFMVSSGSHDDYNFVVQRIDVERA